jgi:transcriptional regulator with XRE-family HTH domain
MAASYRSGPPRNQSGGDGVTGGDTMHKADAAVSERRAELARFLRDRRARLRPEQVGLPAGARRRVPGLRREEVATLAGVGVTWYTLLESGAEINVSAPTLDAICAALRLSDDETAFAHGLASGTVSAAPPDQAPDRLALRTIDGLAWPAYICTSQWNVLAWNAAFARVWGIEPPGGPSFNIVRRMWSPELRALHGDRFPAFAARLTAMVRAGTARRLGDPDYRALYADLSDDPTFDEAWRTFDIVTPLGSYQTTIDSPAVGQFSYEALTLPLPQAAEQSIVVQVPDAAGALRLMAESAAAARLHSETGRRG